MGITDDRTNKSTPALGWVIFTDSFLSGWGGAEGGLSLYALAVDTETEALTVMGNGERRTDMKLARLVTSLRADGTPRVRLGARDRLDLVDSTVASRWYERGAFAGVL